MPKAPNLLFLMTDQMQARVLDPQHPCRTPHLDQLAARGVRFTRAYTTNPICSPARASLMTGLLPHSHGVYTITHSLEADRLPLRADKPHWAQRLVERGYRTSYFGKWHVEETNQLHRYGWQSFVPGGSPAHKQRAAEKLPPQFTERYSLTGRITGPTGYGDAQLYAVTNRPPEARGGGALVSLAEDFITTATGGPDPWCCFVSVTEPHDPFVCGEAAFAQYDPDRLALPPNAGDPLADRPGLYRKTAGIFAGLTDRQRQEAMACYYGSVSEVDQQYGRLLGLLDRLGQRDNTIVVLASDHGEALGAHGLFQKNAGAFEEIYNIPLIVAGPGVAQGRVTSARVGIHDLCPTLLELTGAAPIPAPDSRSFASVLRDPARHEGEFTTGYAEYFGTRYFLTQRVIWNGPWKLVWNGFDFDELYNLETDPWEMTNRIQDPACREVVGRLMQQAWRVIRETNDQTLLHSDYASLRLAPVGPKS